MNKFLNWIEYTYGNIAVLATVCVMVLTGVFVAVFLIVFTYGAALLLLPIGLADLYVKYCMEQGK